MQLGQSRQAMLQDIWVIKNFIAYKGATYIIGLMVYMRTWVPQTGIQGMDK